MSISYLPLIIPAKQNVNFFKNFRLPEFFSSFIMRPFVVLALFVAGAASIPTGGYGGSSYGSTLIRESIPIVSLTHEIRGSESDNLQYQTGNGISVSEHTQVVQGRGGSYQDENGQMVQSNSLVQKTGSFSYTSPEGTPISLNYVADSNGFRAEGAHLPRPVELPAEHAQAHREALARVSSSSSYGSYETPVIRQSSYESAPAIRVQSYDAPAPAPVVIRSGY